MLRTEPIHPCPIIPAQAGIQIEPALGYAPCVEESRGAFWIPAPGSKHSGAGPAGMTSGLYARAFTGR
ncbi:MAG: hypothetical protein M0Z56_05690 [Desulfobacteraceae bacterium]|nr:hypothetical protein [Desulfobacteraceae bacterium]